jgi:hypothetical protein
MRRIEVRSKAGRWMVYVRDAGGDLFEHACASRCQARYFAAVYRLQRAYLRGDLRGRRRLSDGLAPAPEMR